MFITFIKIAPVADRDGVGRCRWIHGIQAHAFISVLIYNGENILLQRDSCITQFDHVLQPFRIRKAWKR